MQYPVIYAVFFCVRTIASAVFVLAWLRVREEEESKSEDRRFARFSDLPVWYFQRCSPAKLTVLLLMEALDNAWSGSWRPLTNLTYTFRVCHLCTFNVAPIFFGVIPIYGVLPYAMIVVDDVNRQIGFHGNAPPSCKQCPLIKTVLTVFPRTWSLPEPLSFSPGTVPMLFTRYE